MTIRTQQELQESIISKASDDGQFRSSLLSDPKNAIQDAFGINVPEKLDVQVHEDTAENVHLVLPVDSRLTKDELDLLSGGATWDGIGVQF